MAELTKKSRFVEDGDTPNTVKNLGPVTKEEIKRADKLFHKISKNRYK